MPKLSHTLHLRKPGFAALLALASFATQAEVSLNGKVGVGYNKQDKLPELSSPPVQRENERLHFTDLELQLKAAHHFTEDYLVKFDAIVGKKSPDESIKRKEVLAAFRTPIGQLTAGFINTGYYQSRAFADTKISLPADYRGEDMDTLAFTTMLGPLYATVSYSETGTEDLQNLARSLAPILTGGFDKNNATGGPGPGNGPIHIKTLVVDYPQDKLFLRLRHSQYSTNTSKLTDAGAIGVLRSGYEGRKETLLIATYDFDFLKAGISHEFRNMGWAQETKAGVNVPLGPWSLGMTYEHKNDDTASLGGGVKASQFAGQNSLLGMYTRYRDPRDFSVGDVKGTAARTKIRFGVNYDWDASTSVNFSYGRYRLGQPERVSTMLGSQPSNMTNEEFQLRVMKTF